MTRDDRFIQQIERYLDEYEGVTTLPERVRSAIRAELPKTKQAGALRGPARYLTVFSTRTAQVALGVAAAALIVAVGAFLYSGRDVGGPDDGTPSPTTDLAPSTTSAPSGEAACERTAVVARTDGMDVTWCAYGVGEPASISFTMEGPSAWVDQYFSGFGSLWLRPAGGGAITLDLVEGQSVDEVVADVSGREGYAVADEAPVTLGGAAGVVFDVSLAEGVTSGEAPPLIADPDQTWRLQDGTFTRVWIVDVAGDTVMIATGEDLADAVGEALGTIQWTD
ncbi:MAG TPA: hypothetical protein VF365_05360 [Candidatus Limnocylindria bacterium]